jgi:hypothetical protein
VVAQANDGEWPDQAMRKKGVQLGWAKGWSAGEACVE